jgi:hypothetical protein
MNLATYIPIAHNDDYWTSDIPLFAVTIAYYHNNPRMVQGRIHTAEERYFGSASEIVPLKNRKGTCIYVNMHPYILEPELFMTVGMYPKPKQYADQDEAIGEVLSTQVKGMKQHQVGNSQAWYYPADKTIVLWECFLDAPMRTYPFIDDPHMMKLWQSFEKWLMREFPEATRIATPFNDPIANSIEEYQTFLRSLGYEPVAQAAFGKKITRETDKGAEYRGKAA